MSRDFFEDDYKDMDPWGFYDLDGDGSYDDDERFYIDEEIRSSLKGTLMFRLRIEHLSGKIVTEK